MSVPDIGTELVAATGASARTAVADPPETFVVADRDVEAEVVTVPKKVPSVALGPRAQLRRFERITAVLGVFFLIAGLAVWRFKPHTQDRLALLILVVAMFLAILHHYSIEEGRSDK